MRFWQTHATGSDETAPYDVTEYKAITAEDFVHEVLISQPHDWGKIHVNGFGRVEYRSGELLTEIPQKWRYLTVVSVKSAGGWSNMDYHVRVNIFPEYYKQYLK